MPYLFINFTNMIIAITSTIDGLGKTTSARIVLALLQNSNKDAKSIIAMTKKDKKDIYKGKWKIRSFAFTAVKMYQYITGINFYTLSRDDKEQERSRFRYFCESMKDIFNPRVWVDRLFKNYTKDSYWVIPDLRFKVEYEKLIEEEAIIIGLRRSELEDFQFPCSHIIENNSTLEELVENLRAVLKNEKLI